MNQNNQAKQSIQKSSAEFNANLSFKREAKFKEIIQKHDISPYFYSKLQLLQGFKIVFVFDDSGSMNIALQESPLNSGKTLLHATRWDELQYFANISLEIASIFDQGKQKLLRIKRKKSNE
jgi:hypothetical protein